MAALLLDQIPDIPRWVEARCTLLRGGRVAGELGSAAIVSPERDLICVAGAPTCRILDEALEGCEADVEIIAQEGDAQHVSGLLGAAGAAHLGGLCFERSFLPARS